MFVSQVKTRIHTKGEYKGNLHVCLCGAGKEVIPYDKGLDGF